MRVTSQQVVPDSFFGGLGDDIDLHRGISNRRFVEVRDRPSWSGLQRLNALCSADVWGSLGAGRAYAW